MHKHGGHGSALLLTRIGDAKYHTFERTALFVMPVSIEVMQLTSAIGNVSITLDFHTFCMTTVFSCITLPLDVHSK